MSTHLFNGFTLLRLTKSNKNKRMRLGFCKNEHVQYIVHMEDDNDLQGEYIIYNGTVESEAHRIYNKISSTYFDKGN